MSKFSTQYIQAGERTQEYDILGVTFHARCTRAQRAYDGFGTLELTNELQDSDGKPVRLVLIREDHLNWQESRYASGLGCFAFPPAELYIDSEVIADALWKKLNSDCGVQS